MNHVHHHHHHTSNNHNNNSKNKATMRIHRNAVFVIERTTSWTVPLTWSSLPQIFCWPPRWDGPPVTWRNRSSMPPGICCNPHCWEPECCGRPSGPREWPD
jgi:hypothetical protein